MTDLLLTSQLRLRRPTVGDAAEVFRVHGDPDTNRFNPSGPDADLAASEERLRSWLAHWADDGIGYHVVEDSDSGEVLGFTGVRHTDAEAWGEPPEPLLNLYYRFAPRSWGTGVASKAVGQVLSWAKEHRPERPVVVVTRPDNEPSLRLARRQGFSHYRDISYGRAPSVEYRLRRA
jgi:RimJ/RimL family protein N-acetyltransferase